MSLLAPRDEEGQALRESIKPGKVEVPAVHQVKRTGLDRELVQTGHIGHVAAGNVHKTRDIAAEIDQRVKFDRALATTELRPGEKRQAQVHRRGIESVRRLRQVQREAIVVIQRPGSANEHGREVRIDAPVARFVGVGERAAAKGAANSSVVELGAKRPQTGDDVAQALAVGQLREDHAEELIPAAEGANASIAFVASDTLAEFLGRQEVDKLAEDGLSAVQRGGSLWLEIPKDARTANRNSNRLRALFRLAFCSFGTYNGSKKPQPDSTD